MKKLIMVVIASITMVSCSKSDLVTPTGTTVTNSQKRTTSVQCISNTQSGVRCRNFTLSMNSKCFQHGGN